MDRPLGGLEHRFWLAGLPARINVVSAARVEGPVDPAQWRRVLDLLPRRHPLVGAKVVDEASPRFVTAGAPPIPLRVERRQGPGHLHRVVEQELQEPFPPTGLPLARSVLLHDDQGADVVFTCHHLIGDALAVLDLFQDSFRALAALEEGAKDPMPPLPEAPPLAAMLPPVPFLGLRKKVAFARSLGAFLRFKPQLLPREGDAPPGQRRSHLLHTLLDEATTKGLAAACKAQGTSVHGAVAAAALLAAAEAMPQGQGAFGLSSPVNLRPLLKGLPAGAFGYYAWGVTTYHRVGGGSAFWDLAREVRAAVQREAEPSRMLVGLVALERDPGRPPPSEAPAIAERLDKFSPAVRVSSFGKLEAPERFGPLRWTEFLAVDNRDTGGANLGFASHTFRGRLTLDLVWPEPLVSRATAERAHSAVVRRLREAAET